MASDVISGEKPNLGKAFRAAGSGAISGALVSIGIPPAATVAVDAALSGVESVCNNWGDYKKGTKTLKDIALEATFDAGVSAIFSSVSVDTDGKKLTSLWKSSRSASKVAKQTGKQAVKKQARVLSKRYYKRTLKYCANSLVDGFTSATPKEITKEILLESYAR